MRYIFSQLWESILGEKSSICRVNYKKINDKKLLVFLFFPFFFGVRNRLANSANEHFLSLSLCIPSSFSLETWRKKYLVFWCCFFDNLVQNIQWFYSHLLSLDTSKSCQSYISYCVSTFVSFFPASCLFHHAGSRFCTTLFPPWKALCFSDTEAEDVVNGVFK